MSEEEWMDVASAAERCHCSTQSIRRRIKRGELEAKLARSIGNDGRWVIKIWIRVSDLDEVSGVNTRKEHLRKIRSTARPFTDEQKIALRKVFLAHILEREERRKRAESGGTI